MDSDILIRSETAADVGAITAVTVAAFEPLEISRHTEQYIVSELRSFGGAHGIARRGK